MKIGDTVFIPQGYWPQTGRPRNFTPAIVEGFNRHLYSTRPDGQPDTVQVRDSNGTWILDIETVRGK